MGVGGRRRTEIDVEEVVWTPGRSPQTQTPHPEPWSFTLCQHLARRSQTRHELLENEMQERFSIIDPMILLYLISLAPELGEFSDRYVIPMLTMLWKGACRKRPNIPCVVDASRGLHGQPLGEHLD